MARRQQRRRSLRVPRGAAPDTTREDAAVEAAARVLRGAHDVRLLESLVKGLPGVSRGRPRAGIDRRIRLVPKGDALEMDGTVVDTMRNSQFTVRLDNGHELLAYTGGKMRRFRIRILLGDRVRVEMSPYDLTRGRVSYRYR